ncbi:MAG: hypothetical protein JXE07_02945 [Candidatus Aminicenantes bacterium]|nr:hypothetical protein [Candidatus Aminicenantes bacterium]
MNKGRPLGSLALTLGLLWLAHGISAATPGESAPKNSSLEAGAAQFAYESVEQQVPFGHAESIKLPLVKENRSGQVWAAWEDWRNGRNAIGIGRLEEEGRLVPALTTFPGGSNFSPDFAFGPGDTPWAVWGNFSDRGYSIYIQDIASRRRWRLFPAESTALTDPKIVFDGSGFIQVFWNETRPESWRIVSRTFDGTVWSPRTTALRATASPTVNPDVVRDGRGSIWLAWSAYDGRDYEIYLSRSDGHGWTSPVPLTDNEENDLFPSLGIGANDELIISWEMSSAAGNRVFAAMYKENEPLRKAPVSPSLRESVVPRTVFLSGKVSIVWRSADGPVTRQWTAPFEIPENQGADPSPERPRIFNPDRDGNAYIGFGDSITYGYIDRLPAPELGYPPRLDVILDQNFGPTEMINEGLGREKTPEGLIRIETVLDSHAAGSILIMEGTNDVINYYISMDTSLFNIKEMARKSLEAGVFPTITTIIPRRDWVWSDPQVRTRQAYLNEQIRLLPAELHVSFVDMDRLFLEFPAEDGGLLSLLCNDFKHPSEKGYQFMAEAWFDEIRNHPFPPVDIRLKRRIPEREKRDGRETISFRVPRNPRPAASRKERNLLSWQANPKIFNPARIKGYKIYRATQGEAEDGFHFLALVPDVSLFVDSDIEMLKQYVYLISTLRDDDVEGPCSGPIDQ